MGTRTRPSMGSRSALPCLVLCGAVLALIAVLSPGKAQAAMEIQIFTNEVSTSQAGGHPDIDTRITWTTRSQSKEPCNCEDPRTVSIHYPTGFIGNPHAVARCGLEDFSTYECPPEAQVGIVEVNGFLSQLPIYNMEPHPDEAGLIAFNIPLLGAPAYITLRGRTDSDYGLSATSSAFFHLLPVSGFTLHLWGVPADEGHDANRFPPRQSKCSNLAPYPEPCFPPVAANIPAEPFLQNPTTCGVPLTTSAEVEYYEGTVLRAEAPWPETTGCDLLSFNPSLSALPTTRQADTPSGLDVDLEIPQTQSPTVPTPSQLRSTKVTLPEGFAINPGAPDGKQACSDEEARFGTEEAARCPEHAKVGTLRLNSSALPGPINGAIYLGTPKPDDPYPIILAASGFATNVKFRGSTQANPQTGQIVTSFPDLPQSPFSEFDMHFFGSERGLFVSPAQCGSYPVQAEFVPWDEELEAQHSTSFFTVDSGPTGKPCPSTPRPFSPQLQAGSPDNTAAVHSPLSLSISRADGEQLLSAANIKTPPGFSASLRGIPYCPDAALSAIASDVRTGRAEQVGSLCPSQSQVGSMISAQGAGSHPVYTPGKVYLAGPYKGAPLSLALIVPAVVGPYDLGNVVTRVAIRVDPRSAQLSALSDPIPTILEGIPLRVRSIRVDLDREDFALNPTNCDPFSVDATLFGDQGALANPSADFQVANCAGLAFGPRLALRLSGGTTRTANPALSATLTPAPGEANVARVSVSLPRSLQVDNSHIENPCTRVQFTADACPPGSVIGTAKAETPLLDKPLSGPVYLRSSSNKLPDIVADLQGQIDVELVGEVVTVKRRLRTIFKGVPDVPVSKFTLSLFGGKRGLLEANQDLCRGPKTAAVRISGQNGAALRRNTRLATRCEPAARKQSKRHARKAG